MVSDRFSLHRFSLGSGDNAIEFSQTFTTELNVVAGSAVKIDSAAFFSSVLQATARGTLTVPSMFNASDSLSTDVQMRADIRTEPEFSENLYYSVSGVKDVFIETVFDDALNVSAYLGKNVPFASTMRDALFGYAHASRDIAAEAALFESLYTLTNAIRQETETVSVSISIPPGAEIRIDSGTFQMFLDGENVLWAQSGDWIQIARNMIRLDIEGANSGEMTGNLIYTERYL